MARSVVVSVWMSVVMSLVLYATATQVGKGLGTSNLTVAEAITEDTFDAFFPHKEDPLAHAVGFYTYNSFLQAAAMFADQGFGLVGGADVQRRELSAFLAHAAHETTCGWYKAKDGPYAWGLCYSQELSPASSYCETNIQFPCVDGVSYHGRGVFPLYYNFNYGTVGTNMKLPLLADPGLISRNATLAFASAIWLWMTPLKPNPSAHSVMTNKWKPSTADVNGFRKPGFGMTINILNGQMECGHGDDPRADDRISHYTQFASTVLGVDIGANLDCGTQEILPLPDSYDEKSEHASTNSLLWTRPW